MLCWLTIVLTFLSYCLIPLIAYSDTVPGRLAVARPILPLCVARFILLVTPRLSVLRRFQLLCPLLIRTYYIGPTAIFCVPLNRSFFIASSHLESSDIPRARRRDRELLVLAATSSLCVLAVHLGLVGNVWFLVLPSYNEFFIVDPPALVSHTCVSLLA